MKTEWYDRMIQALQLNGKGERTQEAYARAVRMLVEFQHTAPDEITAEDEQTINHLLLNHSRYTESIVAKKILANFYKEKRHFVKVMPLEYKRILEMKQAEEKLELSEVSDG